METTSAMADSTHPYRLQIEGMHCAGCVAGVESALRKLPGAVSARANLASRLATVVATGKLTDEQLMEAVAAAGYRATPITERTLAEDLADDEKRSAREIRDLGRRAILAMGSAVVFFFLAGMLKGPAAWFFALLAGGIQLYVGWPIYQGAFDQLRRGNTSMDTLLALGTSLAWVAGSLESIEIEHLGTHGFFDGLLLLGFVCAGRYLEARVRYLSSAQFRDLLRRQPAIAHQLSHDQEIDIPAESLIPGDIVLVKPGENFPADGIIHLGDTTVEQSMITGESLPSPKTPGQSVIAGTINLTGLVQVEVTNTGEESTLYQMVEMVREAKVNKSRLERLADTLAKWFVPAVLILVAVTFSAHLYFSGGSAGIGIAARSAMAVLLVACPCAFGLATPTAVFAASLVGARSGLLIREAAALERAGMLSIIAFDKTGTLTTGKLRLRRIQTASMPESEFLLIAAAISRGSNHPIAIAILQEATNRNLEIPLPTQVRNFPGGGIRANVSGRPALLGSRDFLASEGVAIGGVSQKTEQVATWLAIAGQPAGVIEFMDEPRRDAKSAIAELRKLNLEPWLITGDRLDVAYELAKIVEIPIQQIVAQASPAAKQQQMALLQGQGHRVAMVGDGINDAGALAAADLGIAMRSASETAKQAGDVILLSDGLMGTVRAVQLGRRLRRTVLQNFVWALLYNILLLPAAALGHIPPFAAAAAMAASSLTVVLNSWRLSRLTA